MTEQTKKLQQAKHRMEEAGALVQFHELTQEAEIMDKAELQTQRRLLRRSNTQNAKSKLQQVYGKQYRAMTMMDAERDVADLLRDDEERLKPPAEKTPEKLRKEQPDRGHER